MTKSVDEKSLKGRIQAVMNQGTFIAKLGISMPTLGRWVKQNSVPENMAQEVADLLGITVDDLKKGVAVTGTFRKRKKKGAGKKKATSQRKKKAARKQKKVEGDILPIVKALARRDSSVTMDQLKSMAVAFNAATMTGLGDGDDVTDLIVSKF